MINTGSTVRAYAELSVNPANIPDPLQRASALSFPAMSSSVPVGALYRWMAVGKDQKSGWALPLLAHCLVLLAVAMVLILMIAPRFWFVALVDFAIHIAVDRAKGCCVSTFAVKQEQQWFWWLIGIDQALHHLTGFGLSIFMAAN